jgi:RNA polymerase sigma-70 factor, ECF subfamily
MIAVRELCDESAFEELVRRHANGAFSVAVSCLGSRDAAEDAVQESFLRLTRSKGSYRRGLRFAPWFYTMLRNICRDELRRRAVRSESLEPKTDVLNGPDPCTQLVLREDCRAACRALAGLPETDREILALRIHAGLDFRQISEIVGLAEETAKKRAYRALERLRGELSNRT